MRGVQTGRCPTRGLVVGEGRGSSSERDRAGDHRHRRRRVAEGVGFEFLLGYRRELDSEGIFGPLLGAKKNQKV
jgi:hypothetical protein